MRTEPGMTPAPLVAHIIYRLDVGGLENGLVNLINRLPHERCRHAVISLTDQSDFARRITRTDTPVFCLHKPPGNSLRTQVALWRLLRRLQPAIVHTRNLAALECTVAAALACRAVRIHGEHGRDVDDLDGTNRRLQRIRRLFKPFVQRYVAVSQDLARYLEESVDVPASRISTICNGVDTQRFRPARDGTPRARAPNAPDDAIVFGTVGRMQDVKAPLLLVEAFLRLRERLPRLRDRFRLAMAGDGPLREAALERLRRADALDAAWLPGTRNDVPDVMRGYDVFVLPSLAEGISNTVLEAMASGLPVIATGVGGNAELVEAERTGLLVPAGDAGALAEAMSRYALDIDTARRHGAAARQAAETRYGLDVMVRNYASLYDSVLAGGAGGARVRPDASGYFNENLLPPHGDGGRRG